MIEILLVLLVVGFLTYYLIRHPLKSFKIVGATLGLLILGLASISVLVFGALFLIAAAT